MRKVIFPLVIVLALVTSVGAASYVAQVGNEGVSAVDDTQDAELALAPAANLIATDLVELTGDPDIITVNFRNIQRNSLYRYENVLKITNNKPYAIQLKVKDVIGLLGDPTVGFHQGFNFTIVGGGQGGNPDWNQQCMWDDGRRFNSIAILPGDTAWIDFTLACGLTDGNNLIGDPLMGDMTTGLVRNGKIVFEATATLP
jgi:hypothetical protein